MRASWAACALVVLVGTVGLAPAEGAQLRDAIVEQLQIPAPGRGGRKGGKQTKEIPRERVEEEEDTMSIMPVAEPKKKKGGRKNKNNVGDNTV